MNSKKKLNNKGVSLIELLVGFAILAIISGPFIGAFITSTTANTRARRMEEATTAGQNIMEEIRGKKLGTEIIEQLIDDSTIVADIDGIDSVNTISTTLVDTPELYKWDEEKGEFIDVSDNSTVREIKFLQAQSVNNTDYVAEVMLSSNYAQETDEDTGNIKEETTLDEYTDYNSTGFANIYSMNANKDICFLHTSQMDNAGVDLFNVYINETNTRNTVKSALKRTISVDLADANTATMQVKYKYMYSSTDGMEKDLYTQPMTATVKEGLRSLYLYYTPYTPDDAYIAIDETIEVKNTANLDGVTVYIICQDPRKQGNTLEVATLKKPTVNVIDALVGDGDNKKTKIKLRVGSSIYADDNKDETDAYSCRVNGEEHPITGSSRLAKEVVGLTNLSNTRKTDRAFNIKVNVFSKKDYTKAIYDEFITEDGDKDEHRQKAVIALDGSKER